MQDLLQHGLYGCGTVRVNRKGFPVELKKPKEVRVRGDFMVLQKGQSNLTASVWKDKKLVHHLSTLSKPDIIEEAQRRHGPVILELTQPATANAYNKHMGVVDRCKTQLKEVVEVPVLVPGELCHSERLHHL